MYIKQCGNCRDGWGSTPQLISSTSLVALVYLYWGSLCNPIDRKNVKNTNFSCQHMGLLKLKMHQNPFSDPGARWGTYDAPPHPSRLGRGTLPPHSPPPWRLRRFDLAGASLLLSSANSHIDAKILRPNPRPRPQPLRPRPRLGPSRPRPGPKDKAKTLNHTATAELKIRSRPTSDSLTG